jgi:hypothetical protein
MRNRRAPARTGRGGGCSTACDPGSIVPGASKGDPNAVSPSSGAGRRFLDEMWAGRAGSSHWGC